MLTDVAIRKAKPAQKAYKLADAGGLYLYVSPSGGKLWRFDYRFDNRRKTLAVGKYPDLSLLDARDKHREARSLLAKGSDPGEKRKVEKRAGETFESLARRWLKKKQAALSPAFFMRVENRFHDDVFPRFGNLPAAEIEPPVLLRHIRAIEARGAIETARRINGYCGEVFRFGIAEGVCTRDPSADIRDALASPPPVQHQPSLKAKDLPEFLAKLSRADLHQDTLDAIMLTVLSAGRTDEIRFADADEFENLDSDEPLWRISAKRMKMSRPHLVPLSRQAVEIVKRRIAMHPEGLLFARRTKSGTIHENLMIFALYDLGYRGKATMHGFRSTFSTIANERGWNGDWIELALAHVEGSKVRAAYNAAQYLPQRRELLQWWADYIDEQRAIGLG